MDETVRQVVDLISAHGFAVFVAVWLLIERRAVLESNTRALTKLAEELHLLREALINGKI